MRLWVYFIWDQTNTSVLNTYGQRENAKLERFVKQFGERVAAYAWWLYVNDDPPRYNLKPVKHVDTFHTSKGNTIVTNLDDESEITRFPLAAFLAVSEGYVIKAKKNIAAIDAWREKHPGVSDLPYELREIGRSLGSCLAAREKEIPGLKKKLAETEEENW